MAQAEGAPWTQPKRVPERSERKSRNASSSVPLTESTTRGLSGMRLKDKIAIVTGGGQGIGKVIALTLAREGAKVTVASRNLENLESTRKEIEASGGTSLAVQTDLTDETTVRNMTEETLERFGRIDILVNNSGIAGPTKLCEDVTREEWEECFTVNVTGIFFCCKSRHLRHEGATERTDYQYRLGERKRALGLPNALRCLENGRHRPDAHPGLRARGVRHHGEHHLPGRRCGGAPPRQYRSRGQAQGYFRRGGHPSPHQPRPL